MSYKSSCSIEQYQPIKRTFNGYIVRWGKQDREDGTCLYNEALLNKKPTLGSVTELIIRERYSESDELALARQSFARMEEFLEYNRYVEQCKQWACECLEIEYTPTYAPTLTEVLNQLKTLAKGSVEALPDEEAEKVPSLFEEWKPFVPYEVGNRRYNAADQKLYECLQAHTSQADWRPDMTPSLWKRVSTEEWPEWVQPAGATDAYSQGDKVSHNGSHWISLVDGNVWEPSEAVPTLWELKQ